MPKSYDVLLGTIIGDISGSRFEILNTKNRNFEFFHKNCRFTDDSVMTLAIAKAFLKSNNDYSNGQKKWIKFYMRNIQNMVMVQAFAIGLCQMNINHMVVLVMEQL